MPTPGLCRKQWPDRPPTRPQVNFNEPLSMLQRLTEDLEYHHLLDKAVHCTSSVEQMCLVAAFSVSSYSTTVHRIAKPFNPMLGETFELDRLDDMGLRSLCEQVRPTHTPPELLLPGLGGRARRMGPASDPNVPVPTGPNQGPGRRRASCNRGRSRNVPSQQASQRHLGKDRVRAGVPERGRSPSQPGAMWQPSRDMCEGALRESRWARVGKVAGREKPAPCGAPGQGWCRSGV